MPFLWFLVTTVFAGGHITRDRFIAEANSRYDIRRLPSYHYSRLLACSVYVILIEFEVSLCIYIYRLPLYDPFGSFAVRNGTAQGCFDILPRSTIKQVEETK